MQTTCINFKEGYIFVMNELLSILVSGLGIAGLSISAVAIIKINPRIGAFVESRLLELSAVSAGVFLVTSILLMRETIELLSTHQAIIAFLIGGLGYIILHQVFNHHRHGKQHEHEHHDKRSAWKLLIGDTIHNIADGMLLVSSFGLSPAIGFSSAASVALHEFPQEVSEFLVLRKSGYTNLEASLRNFGTALSIFVGIFIGIVMITTVTLQAYLLGATATFFLGIVVTDLFPLKKIITSKKKIALISSLAIGVIVMFTISQLLGHGHSHEDGHVGEHIHEHEEELFIEAEFPELHKQDSDMFNEDHEDENHGHESHLH